MAATEVAMSYSSFTVAVVIGVVVNAQPSLAAIDSVPKFDIERSCRLELSGGPVGGETIASCKADE